MAKRSKSKKSDKKDQTQSEEPNKRSGISIAILYIALGATAFGSVLLLPQTTSPISTAGSEIENGPLETVKEYDLQASVDFISLSPMTVSLNNGKNLLKIGISLEVPYGTPSTISPDDPQIRDALTGYLRALEISQINDAAFMAQIKAQMLHRIRLIHSPETIRAVLITDFLVR